MTYAYSRWLALALGITLVGMSHAHTTSPTSTGSASNDDPYLWLENIHSARSMAWVRAQNTLTAARFGKGASFERHRQRILEVLDSDEHIPYVNRMGDYLYNFWRDKAHPRGLWRRTTLDEYRKKL